MCVRVPNLGEIALLNWNLHFDHHPRRRCRRCFSVMFYIYQGLPTRCAGQTMQSFFPVAFLHLLCVLLLMYHVVSQM